MQIQLTKAGGETTGLAEALHIYAGLTTSVTRDGDDFSAVPLPELAAYLASLSANTAATPYTVILVPSITIDTADTSASGVWATINSTVENAGKYVILDLSACTAVGNTIEGDNTGTPTNNHFNIIKNNVYIKGVMLPATLTSIGDCAFGNCTDLTSVSIPVGVTSIGNVAFANCSSLTNVTIPDGVVSIGDNAFTFCTGLTSVTIPGSVTSIGHFAFDRCTGLTSMTIPDGVTNIETFAFANCSSLTSVTISGSVIIIQIGAFQDCTALTAFIVAESNTAYSSQDGILYNKNKTTLVKVPETKSGTLNNLPDTLTGIGNQAFWNCRSLVSITIPGSVTSIGVQAFSLCIALTSMTIPGSVTSIGDHAFAYCDGLTSVIFGAGSNITTAWGDNAFTDNSYDNSGNSLWAAYTAGSKAGTYTRSGETWTQTQ
jgi:hypothetical protein